MAKIIDILPAQQKAAYDKQIAERVAFEGEIQNQAMAAMRYSIISAIGGYEGQVIWVVGRIAINQMAEDKELLDALRNLQRLPVSEESKAARLAAWGLALDKYLPSAIDQVFPQDATPGSSA